MLMLLLMLLELVFKKETSSNAYEFTGTRGKANFVFFPSSPESVVVVVISQCLVVLCVSFQKMISLPNAKCFRVCLKTLNKQETKSPRTRDIFPTNVYALRLFLVDDDDVFIISKEDKEEQRSRYEHHQKKFFFYFFFLFV